MIVYNDGVKPVPLGKTKEGFPIVLQVGRSKDIAESEAEKLLVKHPGLNNEQQHTEKTAKPKPVKSRKDK